MILSLVNQKGGVAKTTSTFNIATCLAQKGKRVLMVDLDPQASLTIYAGFEPYDYDYTIINVLKDTKTDIAKCIYPINESRKRKRACMTGNQALSLHRQAN